MLIFIGLTILDYFERLQNKNHIEISMWFLITSIDIRLFDHIVTTLYKVC